MGHTLFKGWTDNQLQAAFALANAELATRKKNRKEEHFWRHAAYMANLASNHTPR